MIDEKEEGHAHVEWGVRKESQDGGIQNGENGGVWRMRVRLVFLRMGV